MDITIGVGLSDRYACCFKEALIDQPTRTFFTAMSAQARSDCQSGVIPGMKGKMRMQSAAKKL
jgi:hypothetical protein